MLRLGGTHVQLHLICLLILLMMSGCATMNCSPSAADVHVDVESIAIDLYDHERDRTVPIRAYLPSAEGAHPVVFFSHGLGESRDSYAYLGRKLALNGYVAVHITHAGSDRDLLERDGIIAVHRAVRDPVTWINRPRDVSFVIDALASHDARLLPLALRADLSRIAAAGHSAGAFTALALAGAAVHGERTFRDTRVKAIVAMSLPKLRRIFLDRAYDGITIPMLHMTGTRDTSLFYWTFPRHRRDAFERAPVTPQYLVTIDGATHATFSNPSCAARSREQRMQQLIADATLLFLDAHLQDVGSATDALVALRGATVEVK